MESSGVFEMTEDIRKLSRKYRVLVNDADFTKRLKMSATFNYFQEIAALHAEKLGVGFDELILKHGAVWILARMRVDFTRLPLWNEEVFLDTWPQKPSRVHFERDYVMKDAAGEILATGVSQWVLLHRDTKQFLRPQVLEGIFPEPPHESPIPQPLAKLRSPENLEVAYERVIGCSDIDQNGHMNNSKYLDFIMDCFSMTELENHQVSSIQVNYLEETYPGDVLIMKKSLVQGSSGENSGEIYVEGVRSKDSAVVFRSLIAFKKRDVISE
jgi:acyl-ACP thioesterase